MSTSALYLVLAAIAAACCGSFVVRKMRRPKTSNDFVSPRPLQVLLAEDNPVNQQLAMELLQMRGYAVKLAANGKEVLAALEKDTFDVVLMDVNMPEMDGYQTTAVIREREKINGRHLPIIAITGLSMKGDRERCLQAGMDAYLCKPIRSKELFDAVEQATA